MKENYHFFDELIYYSKSGFLRMITKFSITEL